ncbi:MAG TPA: four helix bundle protein [Anaerolineae bacterium]|nr:four helix bundle protein [Anaerolineae bacterium]
MNRDDMKARTKAFALPVIHLVEELPKTRTGDVIGKQLLRAATSVGANYRAACRGKSKADFIAKLGTVEEEADECVYWLELIVEAELLKHERIICLIREANEITAIIVSSIRTARSQK